MHDLTSLSDTALLDLAVDVWRDTPSNDLGEAIIQASAARTTGASALEGPGSVGRQWLERAAARDPADLPVLLPLLLDRRRKDPRSYVSARSGSERSPMRRPPVTNSASCTCKRAVARTPTRRRVISACSN